MPRSIKDGILEPPPAITSDTARLFEMSMVRRFSRHRDSYRRCLVLFNFGGGLLGCCVQRIAYFLCYERTSPYHTFNEVVTAHVFLVLAASFCRVFEKTLLFCFKHRLC